MLGEKLIAVNTYIKQKISNIKLSSHLKYLEEEIKIKAKSKKDIIKMRTERN